MAEERSGIQVVLIKGSVRPNNYTSMAASLVADQLNKLGIGYEVIDPGALKLAPPGIDINSTDAKWLREKVVAADGVILATPEYHGSFSSVMKLVIENLGFPSVLAGKPVALLGVAAGVIGAIKSLEHLRGVVSHIGGHVLPLPVSVANIQQIFTADGVCQDAAIEARIRGTATMLIDYLKQSVCPRITLEKLLREGKAA